MNEEQKTEITKILIGIAEKGEQVTTDIYSLLQEQSPQLVEEILRWGFISSLGVGLLFLVLAVAGSYFLFRLWRQTYREGDDGGCATACSFVWIAISAIAFCNLSSALKIYIAPRLFIVEYIKVLIG